MHWSRPQFIDLILVKDWIFDFVILWIFSGTSWFSCLVMFRSSACSFHDVSFLQCFIIFDLHFINFIFSQSLLGVILKKAYDDCVSVKFSKKYLSIYLDAPDCLLDTRVGVKPLIWKLTEICPAFICLDLDIFNLGSIKSFMINLHLYTTKYIKMILIEIKHIYSIPNCSSP